jgi:hypothetical protein
MMRKQDVDEYAGRRPFQPFEIRLVDGQRFRFTRIEEFLVGRTTLATVTRKGDLRLISLGLISTIGPSSAGGTRRPRSMR